MENRLEDKDHGLAHDEKDEKKIYRAEVWTARALKRFVTRSFGQQRYASALPIVRHSQLAVGQFPITFTRLNPQPSVNESPGICFSCGKTGHWRAACLNNSFANNFPNLQPRWLARSDAQELDVELEALPPLESEISFSEYLTLTNGFKSSHVPISVRGRLRKSLQFWKDLDESRFFLDTI